MCVHVNVAVQVMDNYVSFMDNFGLASSNDLVSPPRTSNNNPNNPDNPMEHSKSSPDHQRERDRELGVGDEGGSARVTPDKDKDLAKLSKKRGKGFNIYINKFDNSYNPIYIYIYI